jgi:hypothetical protein
MQIHAGKVHHPISHGRRQNGLAPTALFVPDLAQRLTPSRSHIQIQSPPVADGCPPLRANSGM